MRSGSGNVLGAFVNGLVWAVVGLVGFQVLMLLTGINGVGSEMTLIVFLIAFLAGVGYTLLTG